MYTKVTDVTHTCT